MPTAAEQLQAALAQGQPDPFKTPTASEQLQAALNEEPGYQDPQRVATNLERILNLLSIPNNAMAGVAQASLEGGDPLQGALKGIEQHTTFGKVLKTQGLEGPVAATLGLGMDILLDPTTYLGIGGLTKAGQAARTATIGRDLAKFTGSAEELAQFGARVAQAGEFGASKRAQAALGQRAALSFMGQPIVPTRFSERVLGSLEDVTNQFGQSDFGQSLSKMFMSAERRAPEALRAASMASRGRIEALTKKSINEMVKPYQDDVLRMARRARVPYEVAASIIMESNQLGKSPDDILRLIEQGKATHGATRLDSKVMLRAANAMNLANATAIAAEKTAGLPISHLISPLQYMKRAITPEGLAATRKVNPGFKGLGPREWSLEYGAQMMRNPRLRDLTVSQINELGRAGQLPFAPGVRVKEFFHEDPFVSTAFRLSESQQAIGSADFVKGAVRLYGKPRGSAPADWGAVTETLARQLQIPKGTVFPRAVVDLLDSHYERMISPQYLQGFLHNFDKLQGAWKSLTLPIWPSFHLRNLISDTWMITAVPGGIPTERLLPDAHDAVRTFYGMNGSTRIANRNMTFKELLGLSENVGVLHAGAGRDLQELGKENMLQRARDPLMLIQNNRAIRAGVMVGEARENLTRLTYFIDRLKRGDHPIHAAYETKLRLFDYGELAPFEKQVLRRIFPFYSWARNNIPFQIGHMMRRPGYAATFQKTREEIGTAFGAESPSQDAGPLPQFLARGLPVPVGQTPEGDARFLRTQNILPLGDVSQVSSPSALGQMLVDQLSPFPKAIGEAAANYDLFRNRPLERFPGESQSYLGVPVPGRATPFLDLLRPIAELNRLNPGNIFGTEGQPAFTGVARTQKDLSAAERIANYLVARTYSVDPGEQMQREQNALQGAIRNLEYLRVQALSRGDEVNARAAERQIQRLLENPSQALGMRR